MKLTTAQRQRRAELSKLLERDYEKVERAVESANDSVATALQKLNDVIKEYNVLVALAESFASGIAEELRDDYEERSDKWKESDKGMATDDMASEWEDASDLQRMSSATLPKLAMEDLHFGKRASKAFDLAEEPEV